LLAVPRLLSEELGLLIGIKVNRNFRFEVGQLTNVVVRVAVLAHIAYDVGGTQRVKRRTAVALLVVIQLRQIVGRDMLGAAVMILSLAE